MRILIAEDEPVSRRVLAATLNKWGHEVVATADGAEAWAMLQRADAPLLAILDVMMPGVGGIEVCRRVRAMPRAISPYLILLTAKSGKENVVVGLEAGANDYVAKPFDPDELRARVNVGMQMLELQRSLAERVRELEEAFSQVKQLQGLLPICSYCKSIRDDSNYWQRVESYIGKHSDVQFSHSICPNCYEQVVQPQIEELRRKLEGPPADVSGCPPQQD
ncbi:MAG: response regulator transcription factor [Pyrinomonadaceae bacterium]